MKNISEISFLQHSCVSSYFRCKFKSGGVCIFLRNSITKYKVVDLSSLCVEKDFEVQGITISVDAYKVLILVIYRSPSGDINLYLKQLGSLLDNHYNKNLKLIICGDFNINFLDLSSNNTDRISLIDLLDTFGAYQLIYNPTRVTLTSSRCIDNIFTDIDRVSCDAHVITPGFSDHYAQLLQLNLRKSKNNILPLSRKKRNFSVDNIKYFLNAIQKEKWAGVYPVNDVDGKFEVFYDTFKWYFDLFFPEKWTKIKVKQKNSNWLTLGIRKSSRTLKTLSVKYKLTHSLSDKSYYKRYLNIYKKVILKSKKINNNSLISHSTNKAKVAWKIINTEAGRTKQQKLITIPLTINEQSISDPVTKSNVFNSFFINASQNCIYDNANHDRLYNNKSLFLSPVNNDELAEIVKKLSKKHSSGIDQIPSSILIACFDYIKFPLLHIINHSLTTGVFPNKLKITTIKPLLKKGNSSIITNYRPIASLSCFSKIFENIMLTRITKFFEDCKLFYSNQHGFTKSKSTSTAICNFMSSVIKSLDSKNKAMGIFYDLSKAFDNVNHQLLFSKLESFGIRGICLNWVKSYLSNRTQLVLLTEPDNFNRIQNTYSQKAKVNVGVPQGSVLGPLLYLIYVTDVKNLIKPGSELIMYADDTSQLVTNYDANVLVQNANILVADYENWCSKNFLKVNVDKTNMIYFASKWNRNDNSSRLVRLGTKSIKQVGSSKFLGIILDETISWVPHVNELCGKLGSICFLLRRLHYLCDLPALKMVYFAHFHSLISYGVMFWGNSSTASRVFIMQKRAIRSILGFKCNESCREHFKNLKIMTLPSLYLYSILLWTFSNADVLSLNSDIHSYNTKSKNNFHLVACRTTLGQRDPAYAGPLYFNLLPHTIRSKLSQVSFKNSLKHFFIINPFYSIAEFENYLA